MTTHNAAPGAAPDAVCDAAPDTAFDAFERRAWDGRAAAYERSFGVLCAHAVPALLVSVRT